MLCLFRFNVNEILYNFDVMAVLFVANQPDMHSK